MTDPNYWLAAWLALVALAFASAFETRINDAFCRWEQCVATLVFAVISFLAALYCAGFVVVMR